MDRYSRYNYQRNVPENRLYKSTEYKPESALDRFVISRVAIRNGLIDNVIQEQCNEDILKLIDKNIKDVLSKTFP